MANQGRPTKLTPTVVTKLVACFHNAYTETEACITSGISRQTFYKWLREDEAFSYKIAAAQQNVNVKAKEVIVTAVYQGDLKAAQWWLEKRVRAEFGQVEVPEVPFANPDIGDAALEADLMMTDEEIEEAIAGLQIILKHNKDMERIRAKRQNILTP